MAPLRKYHSGLDPWPVYRKVQLRLAFREFGKKP